MPFSIQTLSFSVAVTAPLNPLLPKPKQLSHSKPSVIRMGGGPRTYPGGVSKWQWKRMQAKKAKQLLKARLCRERQIYQMRKRAELRAAVSELERPWEVVERAPNLFSVSADEQLKVLADRFQKPGGFDLWTENDGPQLFQTPDELPSARFFPKGVVHSVKPYRRVSETNELDSEDEDGDSGEELSDVESLTSKISDGLRRTGNRRKLGSSDSDGLDLSDSEQLGFQELDLEAGSHGQLRQQRNWNTRRSYGRKFDDQSGSFRARKIENGELLEPESLNSKSSNGFRRKVSRKTYQASDSNGEQLSLDELDMESGKYVQLGEHKNRTGRQSYARKFRGQSRSFSGGEAENSNSSFGLRKGSRRRCQSSDSLGFDRKQRGKSPNFRRSRGNVSLKMNGSENGVYDMSLQQDGSYGLQSKNGSRN